MKFEWEEICYNTYRAKVFGGWVIRNVTWGDEADDGAYSVALALTFVPDCTHSWEIKK